MRSYAKEDEYYGARLVLHETEQLVLEKPACGTPQRVPRNAIPASLSHRGRFPFRRKPALVLGAELSLRPEDWSKLTVVLLLKRGFRTKRKWPVRNSESHHL